MLMMNIPSCFNNLAAFPIEDKFAATMHIMNRILCNFILHFTLQQFSRWCICFVFFLVFSFILLCCKIEQCIYCLWKLDLFMHALPVTNSDIVFYNLETNSLLDISFFFDCIYKKIVIKTASFSGETGK